ncbi:uncharacterized protein TNIN_112911 [Trichonephila inaurata madagascariensis]|uniref:Uncharacterized protein n=1 Tax=Trichonephila inaurata madagascariensis TaxID=2747483 RepID=A0A8X6YZ12_9ARAC|nr:uncharacterized protein TNIN_112911 [Trichonephila inaurata madagascariensis]
MTYRFFYYKALDTRASNDCRSNDGFALNSRLFLGLVFFIFNTVCKDNIFLFVIGRKSAYEGRTVIEYYPHFTLQQLNHPLWMNKRLKKDEKNYNVTASIPSTADFCVYGTVEIENRITYKNKWLSRNLKSGERNVPNNPLVNPNDILLLRLHIKLKLMKNFVKSINKDGEAFQHLGSKFSRLSDAKIKEGIFMGPQIRKIMKEPAFDQNLEGKEEAA